MHNQITLLGQSAGALSALIHRAHPSTRSLAQNLILMSPPDIQMTTLEASQKLAKSLATRICKTDLSPRECLSSVSTRTLLNAFDDEKSKGKFQLPDANLLPVGMSFCYF